MSSKDQGQGEAEKNIEIWKVKKLIKRLESARGNGTSMISLIIRTCYRCRNSLEYRYLSEGPMNSSPG